LALIGQFSLSLCVFLPLLGDQFILFTFLSRSHSLSLCFFFPSSSVSFRLGDNNSLWPDLYKSISGIISMGTYGIPHVGPDICGFGGDTTAELCSRWIQLGSLYPFARDHSVIDSKMQEAYQFGEPYTSINRAALSFRYSLLPYLYSLFIEAHLRGTPVWRGLFQEFPRDVSAWPNDRQFMLGPALMGVPVLDQGALTVKGYLPNADWFNFYSFTRLSNHHNTTISGNTVELSSDLTATSMMPLLQRGGHVVVRQRAALTTRDTWSSNFTLHVAVDANGESNGQLVLDDGVSIGNVQRGEVHRITHRAQLRVDAKSRNITGRFEQRLAMNSSYPIDGQFVETIAFMGLDLSDLSQAGQPVLRLAGKVAPITGAEWSLVNGALVLKLGDESRLPIAVNWQLDFGETNGTPLSHLQREITLAQS